MALFFVEILTSSAGRHTFLTRPLADGSALPVDSEPIYQISSVDGAGTTTMNSSFQIIRGYSPDTGFTLTLASRVVVSPSLFLDIGGAGRTFSLLAFSGSARAFITRVIASSDTVETWSLALVDSLELSTLIALFHGDGHPVIIVDS